MACACDGASVQFGWNTIFTRRSTSVATRYVMSLPLSAAVFDRVYCSLTLETVSGDITVGLEVEGSDDQVTWEAMSLESRASVGTSYKSQAVTLSKAYLYYRFVATAVNTSAGTNAELAYFTADASWGN